MPAGSLSLGSEPRRRCRGPFPFTHRMIFVLPRLTWDYMWWQVLGSNQRRLSRRFYRYLPIAPSPATT